MSQLQSFVFAIFLFALAGLPVRAALDAELLSGNIPAERVDALIAEHADDAAVVFDLLAIKAAAQTDAGAYLDAAQTVSIQAALAARNPEAIPADLPDLYLDAADLFVKAGEIPQALELYYAALDALADRAAPVAMIADLMGRVADLEEQQGRKEKADALREAAGDLPLPMDEPPANRSNDLGFVKVDVFYATDRSRTGNKRPARFYGSGRTAGLEYGIAEVTIPRSHKPGALEAPSVWKLQFSENPAKHVMLHSVAPVAADGFFGAMQAQLGKSGASDAFVFVHGYNVAFDAAAKRTAQLAHDMNFKGLPVLYSWPSKGATVGYIPDTAVVRLSGRRLTLFLEDLVAKSGARTIHLVSHSMGNRAMTDALELMALRHAPVEKPIFDQVIFAAPDVDMGLFAAMVPTIRPLAKRLTLYASEQDWALEASRKLHGNQPRAGQGGAQALVHEDIDTVDMSILGDDMLAHSYVANDLSAILDISMLFWRNLDPQRRCGLIAKAKQARRQVWQYERSDCSDQDLLSVIGSLRNAGAQSSDQIRSTLRRTFADEPQVRELETMLLDMTSDK